MVFDFYVYSLNFDEDFPVPVLALWEIFFAIFFVRFWGQALVVAFLIITSRHHHRRRIQAFLF